MSLFFQAKFEIYNSNNKKPKNSTKSHTIQVEQVADSLGALDWQLNDAEMAQLDGAALSRSTLDGNRAKRAFFTTLFGSLMLLMRLETWIASLSFRSWFGSKRQ
jgi:hypothetical protein